MILWILGVGGTGAAPKSAAVQSFLRNDAGVSGRLLLRLSKASLYNNLKVPVRKLGGKYLKVTSPWGCAGASVQNVHKHM